MAEDITKIDVVPLIKQYVDFVGFAIDKSQAGNFFPEIEKQVANFKGSINAASCNEKTLTLDELEKAIEKTGLNVEFDIYNKDAEIRQTNKVEASGRSPALYNEGPAATWITESLGSEISESVGNNNYAYSTFINTNSTSGNKFHDFQIKLMSAILQYKSEVLDRYQIIENSKLAAKYLDYAFSKNSTVQGSQIDTIKEKSNQFNTYLDLLHLDDDGDFNSIEIYQYYVKQAIDTYNPVEDNASVFSDEEKQNIKNLFSALQTESSLPDPVKEYAYIYFTEDIDLLLTIESEDTLKLLNILQEYSYLLPENIITLFNKITISTKIIIESFAGGMSDEVKRVNKAVLASLDNSKTPEEITKILNTVDDLEDFKECLKSVDTDNFDAAKYAAYSSTIAEISDVLKTRSDATNQVVPQSIVTQLAQLPDDTSTVLNQLKHYDGDALKTFVDGIVNLNADGALQGADRLASMVDSLPDDVLNLNLQNVADVLKINTNVNSILNEIGVLEAANKLPKSVADLTQGLPPGMSTALNKMGEWAGVNNVLQSLNINNLTGPLQNAIDGALGGASLDNLLNTFANGDLSSIDSIADLADNVIGSVENLMELPAKVMDYVENLPDKIDQAIDKFGGLLKETTVSDLLSAGVQTFGPALVQALPPEARKYAAFAARVLTRLGLDFGLGGLFGSGGLGNPVPRDWW